MQILSDIFSLFIQQQNSTNTVTNVDTNEVETGMITILVIELFVFGMFCQSKLILLLTMPLSNH